MSKMVENIDHRPNVVIVTGLSGSGLSTAINTLQDSGFYCVDNLPVELLWDTLSLVESGKIKSSGFVFGMDIRDRRFAVDFPKLKEELANRVKLDVLFLEADTNTIARRYAATRRRHPLLGQYGDLMKSILSEQTMLAPVRESADCIIDTSLISAAHLARNIESRYQAENGPLRTLFVTVASFGFKHGGLSPAESIQDVRFLKNPYFEPSLKEKTGLDADVKKYVFDNPVSKEFFEKLESFYAYLLPHYLKEGKHFFRIGIGCTGGQHRSVAFAEALGLSLSNLKLPQIRVSVVHRDL
ncbi:MAG: RNase adapter RapZ [Proteobacteria bacterium]|nr:RNase adapter RapZ [Pseudomonadota bacterium]